MTAPRLTHGYLYKLRRADDQLHLIHADIRTFLQHEFQGPTGVIQDVDPNVEWQPIVWDGVTSPDLMWGVRVGEVIHNIRSALDQLAWNLVIANGETPSKDTTFPIYQSEREWLTDLEQRRRAGDRPAPLAGVAPEAFAIIKAAQPYHQRTRPETHPLMRLLRLSNIDKHRSLHVAQITTRRIGHMRIDPPGFASITKVRYAPTGTVVENGAVVAHVQLQWRTVPDTEMQVTGKANLDVAFGQVDQPAIATIPDLYRVVIAAMEVYEHLRLFLVMPEAE